MELLNQKDFEQVILRNVSRMIPGNSTVIANRYSYFSGVRTRNLIIGRTDNCPVYDIGRTYDSYLHGESLESVLQNIQYMVGMAQSESAAVIARRRMASFENAKKYMSLLLVDCREETYLIGKASYRKLGLAAIVRVDCGRWGRGRLLTEVTDWKLREWKVGFRSCYNAAMQNMVKIGVCLDSLSRFVKNPKSIKGIGEITKPERKMISELHILTTKSLRFGASLLFNDEVLSICAEKLGVKKSMAVVPISVNELILVPNVRRQMFSKLGNMLNSLNQGKQSESVALTDHLYVYNVKDGTVKIEMGAKEKD